MILYVCDNKKCNKVFKNEQDIVELTLAFKDKTLNLDLCNECATKLVEFLNTEDKNTENITETKEIKNIDNKTEEGIKNKKRVSIREKINEYGIEKFIEDYKSERVTHEELAYILGVKLTSLRTYIYQSKLLKSNNKSEKVQTPNLDIGNLIKAPEKSNNKIEKPVDSSEKGIELKDDATKQTSIFREKNYSRHKETINKATNNKTHTPKAGRPTKEEVKRNKITSSVSDIVKTAAKGDLSKLELQVEVKSGVCLKCAYRDKLDGICGYSIVTGKSNTISENRCSHFVDVEDLKND